jgi:hypothetical protein
LALGIDVIPSRFRIEDDAAAEDGSVLTLPGEAADRQRAGRKKDLKEGAASLLPGGHEASDHWGRCDAISIRDRSGN